MKRKIAAGKEQVKISIPKGRHDLDEVQTAAYLLTDRAAAYVEESKDAWKITLLARSRDVSPKSLSDDFRITLANQALRAKLRRNNRSVMDDVVSRALAGKPRSAQGSPEESLPPEAKAEIERLLAEAGKEASQRARRKEPRDPLGITKTWEEVNGRV